MHLLYTLSNRADNGVDAFILCALYSALCAGIWYWAWHKATKDTAAVGYTNTHTNSSYFGSRAPEIRICSLAWYAFNVWDGVQRLTSFPLFSSNIPFINMAYKLHQTTGHPSRISRKDFCPHVQFQTLVWLFNGGSNGLNNIQYIMLKLTVQASDHHTKGERIMFLVHWCTSQMRWHHEKRKLCEYIETIAWDISQ